MRIYLSGPDLSTTDALARALCRAEGRERFDLGAAFGAGGFEDLLLRRGRDAALAAAEAALAAAPEGAVVVLDPLLAVARPLRRRLLREGVVVFVEGEPGVGAASLRSQLAPPDELFALLRAEAHGVLEGATDAAVEDARRVVAERPVLVALGERSYRVEIGQGVRARLRARVDEVTGGDVVLVHDDPSRRWPTEARDALSQGRELFEVVLTPGEEHKTAETAARIWDVALSAGADRRVCVVGVGGGVVGDLTAFAASTLLRGVALGQLPTTLLSMVDSSVGGKTGFNRAAGKNLVGTFYQPRFVLCDVDTLTTLDDAERVAGLAEVVKSAWLDGEASVAGLEADADALRAGDAEATVRAVRMSVRLKARVVEEDENEGGTRMLLNLGHTVGHGLEAAANYRGLRHGEGVALGMVAALRVGRSLGRASADDEARLVALMARLGLPVDLDAHLSDRALAFMASDKKRRGASVRFVVPSTPGQTSIVPLGLEAIRDAVRR